MVTYNDDADPPQADGGSLTARVFSTRHKTIGRQYLWLSLASVLCGMALSTLLRMHSSWPGTAIPFLAGVKSTPERYAAVRLLHGSLMVFFVLTAAPQLGFGNFLLPLQIGAREMAFPRLNFVSLWLTVLSLAGMTASFFFPLSAGLNVWLESAAIFSLAALFSALNFSATTIEMRAKGMTLPRMPVTVWAWFLNAILSLLIFSAATPRLLVIQSFTCFSVAKEDDRGLTRLPYGPNFMASTGRQMTSGFKKELLAFSYSF